MTLLIWTPLVLILLIVVTHKAVVAHLEEFCNEYAHPNDGLNYSMEACNNCTYAGCTYCANFEEMNYCTARSNDNFRHCGGRASYTGEGSCDRSYDDDYSAYKVDEFALILGLGIPIAVGFLVFFYILFQRELLFQR